MCGHVYKYIYICCIFTWQYISCLFLLHLYYRMEILLWMWQKQLKSRSYYRIIVRYYCCIPVIPAVVFPFSLLLYSHYPFFCIPIIPVYVFPLSLQLYSHYPCFCIPIIPVSVFPLSLVLYSHYYYIIIIADADSSRKESEVRI